MKNYIVFLALSFLLLHCHPYPRDPEKTLENVSHHELLVGYSVNPPWVIETSDSLQGVEVALMQEFAQRLHAEIRWIPGTENELFKDLADRKLHMVIAGLTRDTPWKKEKIGITRTYYKTGKEEYVMAILQGENAFLVALEKFLLTKEHQIKSLVEKYENHQAI